MLSAGKGGYERTERSSIQNEEQKTMYSTLGNMRYANVSAILAASKPRFSVAFWCFNLFLILVGSIHFYDTMFIFLRLC